MTITGCTLYLIRHGATDNNVAQPPVLQGCGIDGPLSEEGTQQAAAVSGLLSRIAVRAIYSSLLLRARQTAEAIARHHTAEVQTIAPLREVNVGDWEGRSWIDIARDDPSAYRAFQQNPDRFGYPGGESLTDVLQRVEPEFVKLLKRHQGDEIVVVGHNVVNRVFLAKLLHIPLRLARTIQQDNCGVNVIRQRGDDEPVVTTLNGAFHLSD